MESDREGQPLIAQAANLKNLIGYQEEAVVSRTLIDKKAGTVTLFAFDKGQGLSEHTAPYDALAHIIEGEVEIRIAKKVVRMRAGEIVIMPANQPHSLTALKRFRMVLTMIRS
ncbi:MAG: cupin domain-containing protein [Candidatus Bathyarchaeota archaeon]|nr:MAG: cupin domain-containing protein [Candidatus Bathyarchaeota archaeon]